MHGGLTPQPYNLPSCYSGTMLNILITYSSLMFVGLCIFCQKSLVKCVLFTGRCSYSVSVGWCLSSQRQTACEYTNRHI